MTGSGLGCPDWPQCFGQWVPPTDISQLPEDYKSQYAIAGREIADFDAFKTWVEYINRLIGVLIGLLAIATTALSLRLPRGKGFAPAKWLSAGALLMTIVQGGIGAYVVRTHLHTGMISLHMGIALLILGMLITARLYAFREKQLPPLPASLKWSALLLLIVTLVQIFLGTQVREMVDVVSEQMGEAARNTWLSQLGITYEIHQVSYYLVVVLAVALGLRMRHHLAAFPFGKWMLLGIGLTLGAEVVMGIGMHNFGIPAWMQPLHLLFATCLFACEWALLASLLIWKHAKPAELSMWEHTEAPEPPVQSPTMTS